MGLRERLSSIWTPSSTKAIEIPHYPVPHVDMSSPDPLFGYEEKSRSAAGGVGTAVYYPNWPGGVPNYTLPPQERRATSIGPGGAPGQQGYQDPPEVANFTTGAALPTWQNHRPQWRNWYQFNICVQQGYKNSHITFACVYKRATDAANIPWHMEQRQKNGKWVRITGHPEEELLQRPNDKMSAHELFFRITACLLIGGNCVLSKVRAGDGIGGKGNLLELWPLDMDGVRPVPDAIDYISYYQYFFLNRGPYKIDPRNVVHFQLPDPANPFWGVAPLAAAGRIIDTQVEAVSWNKVAMQNRAVPDGMFVSPHRLTREQYDDLKEIIRDQHQGPASAREPWLMTNGLTWNPMGLTAAEMDFIDSLKMYREDICCVFGCPPPVVGFYDNATYNNVDTARRIYWEDTQVPYLKAIRNIINTSVTDVDYDGRAKQIRANFDVSHVEALQQRFLDKVTIGTKLFAMGYPVNIINERLDLGMPTVEGGDTGYLPMTLAPADDIGDGATLPQNKPQPSAPVGMVAVTRATGKGNQNMQTPDGPVKFTMLIGGSEYKVYRLSTKQQKSQYYKSFNRARDQQVPVVAKTVNGVFRKEATRVVAAVKAGHKDDAVDAVIDSMKPAWKKAFKTIWASQVDRFGQQTMDALQQSKSMRRGRKSDDDDDDIVEWDPTAEGIQKAIDGWVAEKIVGVAATTKAQVALAIKKGVDAGETVPQIAKRIKSLYSGFDTGRSMTIARTEVIGASNYGSRQAAQQSGVVKTKSWLTSRDDRVRDSHADIDGETQPLDEEYSNGLMYPGDPDGDPGEVVNCRCVEVYDTEGDSDGDESEGGDEE